jgi:hypothetical protein
MSSDSASDEGDTFVTIVTRYVAEFDLETHKIDTNICHDLAKHGFPNVRTPIASHHPHDLPVIREYARVLEPEERFHVAVMVPVEMLEGNQFL